MPTKSLLLRRVYRNHEYYYTRHRIKARLTDAEDKSQKPKARKEQDIGKDKKKVDKSPKPKTKDKQHRQQRFKAQQCRSKQGKARQGEARL